MAGKKRKRKPGYESEHPDRPWMPDVPGHHQRGHGGESKESIRLREEQTRRLNEELRKGDNKGGPENEG